MSSTKNLNLPKSLNKVGIDAFNRNYTKINVDKIQLYSLLETIGFDKIKVQALSTEEKSKLLLELSNKFNLNQYDIGLIENEIFM